MKLHIIFHSLILAFFIAAAAFTGGNIRLDADLLNMIPKSFSKASFSKADSRMTANANMNCIILVKNSDFEAAKKDAAVVWEKLKESDKFDAVSLYNDMEDFSEINEFLYKYRWALIKDESAEEISQKALYNAFSPINISSLENLDTDPYLLSENALQNYLKALESTGTKLHLKDGVLACEKDGFSYVMVRCLLNKKGSALSSKENAVVLIKNVCSGLSSSFVFSGTPFHSYESSTSAMKEITVITIISVVAVTAILLFVFRSPLPLFVTVATILLSVLSGFLMTLAVFKTLHVMVLIFGTSLIGSCIDYSLHFFIGWKGNPGLKDGYAVRNNIRKALVFSFVSTVLCYSVLFFAPYNLLHQMAVFSITGFVSTFLTVFFIYPKIRLPEKRSIFFIEKIPSLPPVSSKIRRASVAAVFVLPLLVCFAFRSELKIQNNVASLYTMKGKLLSDEIEAATVLGVNNPGYFIVKGESEEAVLENVLKLETEVTQKIPGISLLSAVSFVPPKSVQKKSLQKSRILVDSSKFQYMGLGYSESESIELSEKLKKNFENSENLFVTPSLMPLFLKDAIKNVWLGEIDGNFYCAAIPSSIDDEKELVFRKICGGDENFCFLSKAKDISRDLNHLSKMILIFFAASYVLIFCVLKFFYGFRQVAKILSVPILVILSTAAVFLLSSANLEFFSVTGMILVLGLGLDYIIYTIEGEKAEEHKPEDKLESFAILLSFVTTELSFGILALSSFKPVHFLGLSIFTGLAAAFIISRLYHLKKN